MKDFPLQKKKIKKLLKAVKRSKNHEARIKEKDSLFVNALLRLKKRFHFSTFSLKSPKAFFKNRESDLQLALLPLILLVILLTLVVVNKNVAATIPEQTLPISNIDTDLHPYPFIESVPPPQVTAKAAIIVDSGSQVLLFSKNPGLRFSMASTTKIMTALTALDYYNQDAILTVKSVGVEGSGLGLARGEQFTFHDLLYAMLLPSANDAAQTIADNYPGGADAFVQRMNEKAASLHLANTHYADPTGLNDDGDYTSVVDMARLASHAINNQVFVTVTSTKYKFIANRNYTRQYPLNNLNKLLGINGVTGIKTGTTEGAGEVLVTSTIKDGHTYIIVVMQSQDRFADTEVLLQFIDDNVHFVVPTFSSLQ